MDARISNLQQIASINRYTLSEGKQKGLDVLDCNNGRVRFLLNVSKALDIMQVYHEGENIAFLSKNGFSAKDEAFLKRFEGGALYTCGLDGVGNVEGAPLHGSFHNIPAKVVSSVCTHQKIEVVAQIYDSELFGKNLCVNRKITSEIGSSTIRIEDELVNLGYKEEDFCLLYHVNLGYPFLSEGATFSADVKACVPRSKWAKAQEKDYAVMGKPQPNAQETCYFLHLNSPAVSVVNASKTKRVTLEFSKSLPQFVLWKSTASGDYAMGIEPATTRLDDYFRFDKIQSGEAKNFSLSLSVDNI